jgi:hypothetical protein
LDLLSMSGAPGVVTAASSDASFVKELVSAIGWHRHWDRQTGPNPI